MNTKSHLIAALAMSLSLVLASEAQAQGPTPNQPAAAQAGGRGKAKRNRQQPPSFDQLDQNKDGKIVESEVPTRGRRLFARADTNHDNAVTRAEFDAALAQRSQRGNRKGPPTFDALDTNKDGKIVESEVPTRGRRLFARADTNHDNAVTRAEFDAALAQRSQRGNRKGPPTFDALDTNKDGKILAPEVKAQRWRRLSRADTNGDNAVSRAEYDAAIALRRNARNKR